MPAPELDPLLADYLKAEATVRKVLGVDPATITGGAAHAALSEMLQALQTALRERDRGTESLREALDELRTREDVYAVPETPPTADRCYSISDPIDYLDLGRARTSRVRCLRPFTHDGPHTAVLGDGREVSWS